MARLAHLPKLHIFDPLSLAKRARIGRRRNHESNAQETSTPSRLGTTNSIVLATQGSQVVHAASHRQDRRSAGLGHRQLVPGLGRGSYSLGFRSCCPAPFGTPTPDLPRFTLVLRPDAEMRTNLSRTLRTLRRQTYCHWSTVVLRAKADASAVTLSQIGSNCDFVGIMRRATLSRPKRCMNSPGRSSIETRVPTCSTAMRITLPETDAPVAAPSSSHPGRLRRCWGTTTRVA